MDTQPSTFSKVLTVVGKVPWPAWLAAGLVSVALTGDAWYEHQLADAEARGAAVATLAVQRDSTRRAIAAKDTEIGRLKAASTATTHALSATVARVALDNKKLRDLLDEYDLDSTSTAADSAEAAFREDLIRKDSLDKLPDSTLVEVPMELVRAADKVSRDLDALQSKFAADSAARDSTEAAQAGQVAQLKGFLKTAETKIDSLVNQPKKARGFWQTVKHVGAVTLQVVGTIALAVAAIDIVKK